ncbi:MAG: response regulator [Bacteroidales bacterium]|nr:response regulator [Bacteroidales bacterium]
MKLKELFITIHSILIILLIIMGVVALLIFQNQQKLVQSHEIRYRSFVIADELRHSSDDLTRYCRTYVLTGDGIWEKKYWEVLDIRNGLLPRPDGKTIALQDSMKKLGFTKAEFDKLKIAEKNSNELVWTERVAFNAMKGFFDDGTGNFTVKKDPDSELARTIMFDDKYHSDKAKIMNPINVFFNLLDQRTKNIVKNYNARSNLYLYLIIGLIILIATISIISFFIIKHKIINQLDALKAAKEKIEESESRLKNLNVELDKEVEKRTKELIDQNKEYAALNEQYEKQNKELIIAKGKADESNRLKTEFLNNMSHEIRTPMNGILGFSKFLSQPDITEKTRNQYIKIIQNSSTQLMRIVDDILEISQLGSKQIKAYQTKVCLNDLLLEQFSVFDIKAKENKTPLYFKRVLSDEESTILSDESKLIKIISNLIENALKFTNEGYIEFGYYIKENNLVIYVKDTGIGINPESFEIIFDRFSQEEKDDASKSGGLGLGLSIAKENAELIGGNVTLESKKGVGSTFYLTIPYVPAKKLTKRIKIPEKENKDHVNILIVEDEEVNYLYLETIMKELFDANCSIIHAKNGQEAYSMCKLNSNISLVFMDIKMPVMNGHEATRLIKELRPELPVIAQTAYSSLEDRAKAFSVGCDDFISKPITLEILRNMTEKFITAPEPG